MDRRHALAALLAIAALPRTSRATDAAGKMRRVGLLTLASPGGFKARRQVFVARMRDLGYVEGTNIRYDWRFASGNVERLALLARQVAGDAPELAIADSTFASLALRKAAASLPVVMVAADDPVASRLVRTLAQPESNFTGLTAWDPERIQESVKLLARVLPAGAVIGLLLNPGNATYRKIRSRVRYAAVQEGMSPVYLDANNAREIETVLLARNLAREKIAGLVVMSDALFFEEHARIAKLAARARKPAIYPQRQYVEAGGLMSYGPDPEWNYAKAAEYADRILKGARPAELAVEQPKDYEMVVNRAAARNLKLAMPDDLLKQATRLMG